MEPLILIVKLVNSVQSHEGAKTGAAEALLECLCDGLESETEVEELREAAPFYWHCAFIDAPQPTGGRIIDFVAPAKYLGDLAIRKYSMELVA